jgi:hypothetical protein
MKNILMMITTLLFFSCRKDAVIPDTVIFKICPVDTATIVEASPLGNLNPPGHTFPSDHIGFYLKGSDPIPVSAMTEGIIQKIYHNEWSDDYRIEIKHTQSIMSYFDHISNLPPNINEGTAINTGDLMGYGRASVSAIDIGVINYNKINSFIIPERYHEFHLFCDDPYSYFPDSIRQILEKKNPRIGEPKGGKVNYDIDGTLSGNWFLEGTPVTWEASSYLYGENQIAFVYDMYNAATIRISCGGTLEGAPFVLKVIGNRPHPASVTSSSGIIEYELDSPYLLVTMLVEMIDDRKIKVETFIDESPSEVNSFTSSARIYTR